MIENLFMLLDFFESIGNFFSDAYDKISSFTASESLIGSIVSFVLNAIGTALLPFLTRQVHWLAGIAYFFVDTVANYFVHNFPDEKFPLSKRMLHNIVDNMKDMFNAIKCEEAIKKLNATPENYFKIPDKVSRVIGEFDAPINLFGLEIREHGTHYATEDVIPDKIDTPLTIVKEISKFVVGPASMVVFSLIIMVELFQITTRTEGMRNSGFEAPFKLMVKVAICKIFLDRSKDVLTAIINFSHEMFVGLYNLMMDRSYNFQLIDREMEDKLANMHYLTLIAWWLSVWILCGCIKIIINFILPFVVLARMLEIYMMIALAPLPLATFANQEFSQVGKNFIKQFIGIALKSFVIYLIIIVYSSTFSCLMLQDDFFLAAVNKFSEYSGVSLAFVGYWGPLLIFIGQTCLKPLIFSLMLIGTIMGADRYTKLITGAFY